MRGLWLGGDARNLGFFFLRVARDVKETCCTRETSMGSFRYASARTASTKTSTTVVLDLEGRYGVDVRRIMARCICDVGRGSPSQRRKRGL